MFWVCWHAEMVSGETDFPTLICSFNCGQEQNLEKCLDLCDNFDVSSLMRNVDLIADAKVRKGH